MSHQVHLGAAIDQARALLRDLTEKCRAHQTAGCELPAACIGFPALMRLGENSHLVPGAFAIAIAERAAARPGPTLAAAICAVADTLLQRKSQRVMDFVDGVDHEEGVAFWTTADAAAVLETLHRIGALRVADDG